MAVGYVRPARPEDVSEIVRIQLSTWQTAYRRLIPRHVLDSLDEQWMTAQWSQAVQSPPSPLHVVFVAIEQPEDAPPGAAQGHRVGFAAAGPADETATAPGESADALGSHTAALTELLIEPRWGRRGHGSRLLSACVDHWRQAQLLTAVAWAFEQDDATRKFLTSAGWEPDGAKRALDMEDMLVPQVRLHTALTEPMS